MTTHTALAEILKQQFIVLSGTFFTDLYSRGKTTLTYGAAYALGSHGLGFNVITADTDYINQTDTLTEYVGKRSANYNRGWRHVAKEDLSQAVRSVKGGCIVLIDGGRSPDDDTVTQIKQAVDFAFVPIQSAKDIRNIKKTLQALAELKEQGRVYFVANSVNGEIDQRLSDFAESKEISIIAAVPRMSEAAHEIIMTGQVPELLDSASKAADEFRAAFRPLAIAIAERMALSIQS